jgi:type IV pilus assembly protein PilQ
MRFKQLLITVILLAAVAAAATSELTNISLVAQGGSTVVTITASAGFRHNEYRPVDNVMFVDFPGLSAGKLLDKMKGVQMPGLTGYRIVNYQGAGGAQVARVELTLAPGADVKVSDGPGAVTVRISGTVVAKAEPAAPAAKPAVAPVKPAASAQASTPQTPAKAVIGKPSMPASAAAPSAAGAPSLVRTVNVNKSGNGIQIEIAGTSPMQPKTLKLTRPDRIVVDLPNAETSAAKTVPVNSGDVVSVRMGQFQAAPPVTRVVVDLRSAMDFDVAQNGNNVVVNLHTNATAKATAPKTEPAPAKAAESKPAPKPQVAARPAVAAPANAAIAKPAAAPVQTKAAPVSEAPATVAKAVPQPEQAVAQPPAATPGGGSKPEEFVFVQPTPKPASETKPDGAVQPKADVSAERAAQVMAMNSAPQAQTIASATTSPASPAVNFAAEQRQAQATGQVQGVTLRDKPKYTGEPVSVNLKDADIKDFFRLIHEISGLNIVLDPGVNGSLTLVLDDVPWDQALDIVLRNNGLDRQLDGNVLRIATMEGLKREADMRRAQIQAQALAVDKVSVTRFLSYAHAKDVLPTVKKMLSARGDVITDDRTNAIIIQDIPSVIPDIDKLLFTLDRKTQEVEIEARVVAATRNFARDIGTQLGFGAGNSVNAFGGAPQVGKSPLANAYIDPPPYFTDPGVQSQPITPGQPIKTTAAAIPLFSNLQAVGATSGLIFNRLLGNYRIDAILTMAESRGLLKVLSRPRIVTQNNGKALVRQGVRVPVTTLGQLGGPPTVAYIDAFLRLTVTPQITVENTIFLDIDVENTTADFSRQVNGNPTLITQQATTQVLVTDGGTAVIGGVIQTQNNYTVQQVPLLGDIPILGNAFKRKATSTQTQELIFFITPKIIQT